MLRRRIVILSQEPIEVEHRILTHYNRGMFIFVTFISAKIYLKITSESNKNKKEL